MNLAGDSSGAGWEESLVEAFMCHSRTKIAGARFEPALSINYPFREHVGTGAFEHNHDIGAMVTDIRSFVVEERASKWPRHTTKVLTRLGSSSHQ